MWRPSYLCTTLRKITTALLEAMAAQKNQEERKRTPLQRITPKAGRKYTVSL